MPSLRATHRRLPTGTPRLALGALRLRSEAGTDRAGDSRVPLRVACARLAKPDGILTGPHVTPRVALCTTDGRTAQG